MSKFFVALAHTDAIAHYLGPGDSGRRVVSITNLFPDRLRQNLLFSMSFDSSIHYDTYPSSLENLPHIDSMKPSYSRESIFADCGAFQFQDEIHPVIDGAKLDYNKAWDNYHKKHIDISHKWNEILLCSPDHIISPKMTDKEVKNRFEFIQKNAKPFLQKCSPFEHIIAVGVIHGRTIHERKKQYEFFRSCGYKYAPLAEWFHIQTIKKMLDIVAE